MRANSCEGEGEGEGEGGEERQRGGHGAPGCTAVVGFFHVAGGASGQGLTSSVSSSLTSLVAPVPTTLSLTYDCMFTAYRRTRSYTLSPRGYRASPAYFIRVYLTGLFLKQEDHRHSLNTLK